MKIFARKFRIDEDPSSQKTLLRMTTWRAMQILILTLLTLFALPTFADDDSDDSTGRDDRQTYHLSDAVDLITQQKVDYDKPRIVIREVYPELQNFDAEEQQGVDGFNHRVSNIITEEADQFKSGVTKTRDYQLTLPKSKVKNELAIDYNVSAIKSGANLIISVRFSIQGYATGMAHPYHHHRVLNYDLTNARELTLADLFAPDADYLPVLSQYSRKVLMRRLPNNDMITDGVTPTAEHFNNWNIKSNGLLITFDEYQVAPYVFGPQTIRIPFSVLKDLIPADSPISKCARKKRCGGNNILTGGFIDQA